MPDPNLRVLVIEDNPGDARLLREALSDAREGSFVLTWANCLEAGLQLLAREPVDVVMLDLGLPDSSGLDTFKRLSDQEPHVAVVVLSGLDDEDVAVAAVQRGAQDYLVKGQVSGTLLARSIRYAVERQRTEQHVLHLNTILRAIRRINQFITRLRDREALLQGACDEIYRTGECRGVWVRLTGDGSPGLYVSGWRHSLPQRLERLAAEPPPPCLAAVLSGAAALETWEYSSACGDCKLCADDASGTTLAVKMAHGSRHYGAMALRLPRAVAADTDEQALFQELSLDLAYALHALEAEQDRSAAEAALRQGERQFRALFDSASDALFIHDLEGHLLEANQVAYERLGYTREHLLQGRIQDLEAPGFVSFSGEQVTELRERGHRFAETAHVASDGTLIPVELSSSLIRYGGNLAVLTSARDITARRQVEESQRMAAIGQLAAGVAHEFNNVLAAMSARAQVARALKTPETTADLVESVIRLSARGCEIGRNLMSFARPGEPLRKPLLPDEPIEAALLVTGRELQNSQITVERRYEAGTHQVYADGWQLQQVLVNLLINACHAMPSGGRLTVETAHEPEEGGPGQVVIRVRDTGVGIAPEHLPRVFEPFFTTKGRLGDTRQPGAGLGLFVSRGLVQAHGGTMTLTSQPGEGTTCEIRLAAYDQAGPALQAQLALSKLKDLGDGQGTVLVAEVETDTRHAIALTLQGCGFEVLAVGTLTEALQALTSQPVEVVVSDLTMPGGDGRQLLGFIRHKPAPPPIIFVLGHVEEELAQSLTDLGAAAVITKPFEVAALARLVYEYAPPRAGV